MILGLLWTHLQFTSQLLLKKKMIGVMCSERRWGNKQNLNCFDLYLLMSFDFTQDTEGFVIPSLGIEDHHQEYKNTPELVSTYPVPLKDKSEEIYFGPHGAPPSKQEPSSSSGKQGFKQKLKEADRRTAGTGRENKVDNLREVVGSRGRLNSNMGKGSPRDWLDPHCNEAQSEKRHR